MAFLSGLLAGSLALSVETGPSITAVQPPVFGATANVTVRWSLGAL